MVNINLIIFCFIKNKVKKKVKVVQKSRSDANVKPLISFSKY